MIKLKPEFLKLIKAATKPEDLHGILQSAIELEHSTIPPYLTAMFSLKPGKNREIWAIIHSVVLEEMLHMTIASNILIALGGEPDFIHKDFVPEYPGPLPMNVACNDPEKCLIVGLKGFSKTQVHDVFMAIEKPENPLEYEVKEVQRNRMALAAEVEDDQDFATIGAFYDAIKKKLKELNLDRLPGADRPQVVPDKYYPKRDCFRICTVDDAIKAIDIIVEQGEGTTQGKKEDSPLDPDGELAHYYRFAELYYGRRLVEYAPGEFSYSGPVFPFEVDGLWNLEPNTKAADLPTGSEQRRQADQFNYVYRKLLLTLHQAFNGEPEKFDATIGLMYDVKLVGERLVTMPYPNKVGINCGPPFEYVQLNGQTICDVLASTLWSLWGNLPVSKCYYHLLIKNPKIREMDQDTYKHKAIVEQLKRFAENWNTLYANGQFEEMKLLVTEDIGIANAEDSNSNKAGLICGRQAYYDGLISAYGEKHNLLVMEYDDWEYIRLGDENHYYTIGKFTLGKKIVGVNCWLLKRESPDTPWLIYRVINN